MLPFHGYGKSMTPTTSAEQFVLDRKVKKPLMEKYRRKRINDSLDSLKDFVLMFDNPTLHGAKRQLEKADILERTVACLKKIKPINDCPKEVKMAYEKSRKESFDEGFSAATRAVFDYFAIAVPPVASSLAHHQFQLGLVTHLRVAMQNQTLQIPTWVPESPKSDSSSPSPSESSPNPRKRPWQPWN